jgi:hypothetical protein
MVLSSGVFTSTSVSWDATSFASNSMVTEAPSHAEGVPLSDVALRVDASLPFQIHMVLE